MARKRSEIRARFRVLAAVSTVCTAVLIFAVCMILRSPASFTVPERPPVESNRVYCDRGYSLVVPEDWSGKDAASRISSFSTAARSSDEPFGHIHTMDFSLEEGKVMSIGRAQTVFQNSTAYERLEERPSRKPFGHTYYTYSLLFRRNNRWFQLSYSTNRRQKEMPPRVILDYFDTFRIEEPRPAK